MTPDDLRRWQAEMGLTYDTASKALGVGRQTYSDWLNDRTSIPGPVDLACAALVEQLAPYSARESTPDPAKGKPPRDKMGRAISVGEDVIITDPAHPRHDQLGQYAGLADTLVTQKYRICIDGDIVLAGPGQFDVA